MFREVVLIISAVWWHTSTTNADVLTYTITENQPSPATIADITHDARLDSKYTADVIHQLRFTFTDVPVSIMDLFSITNGVLRTATRIDREAICSSQASCVVQLAIQVRPIAYFEIIKVSVTIEDLNDNAPVFDKAKVTLSLTEASVPETLLSLPTARDQDSPVFGIREYKLEPDSDVFRLKVTGDRTVSLELRTTLDREKNSRYSLTLVAYDTADPPHSGSVAIEVQVTDVNDNNPKFEREMYNVSVYENVTASSRIIQVKANDSDLGLNGQVQYAFDPDTQEAHGDMFEIRSTGEIYVIGSLDHETQSVHSLTVTARDLGTNSLPVITKVIVTVLDLNDNAPTITIKALTTNGKVQVSESAEQGTFVAYLTIRDLDSGLSGAFECSLNDTYFTLLQLYETDFKLITASLLDRESKSFYDLRLSCSDKGEPSQSSSKTFTVNVVDENDNFPVFAKHSYKAAIQENALSGTFVVQVQATDADEDNNAAIVYSLEAKMHGYLFIDAISGNITTLGSFDYERTRRIQFLVTASDPQKAEFNTSTTVILEILDADDEKPTFTETGYRFLLPENSPINSSAGNVIASDSDSRLYNWFEFSIPSTQKNANLFWVNSTTGEVFTRESFDREHDAAYEFVVVARGLAPRQLSSSVLVFVQISDENDNAPVIDYPNVNNDTIRVSSQTPVGHVIAQILGHDDDSDDNAKLTYMFTSGSGEGFEIDENSGLVTVVKAVENIKYERFALGLHIKDNGDVPRTASMTFYIVVDETVVFVGASGDSDATDKDNLTIVIAIACVSALLAVVLVIAILVFVRRQKAAKDKLNTSDDSNAGRASSIKSSSVKSLVGGTYDQAPPAYPGQGHEGYVDGEAGYRGDPGFTNHGIAFQQRNYAPGNDRVDFSNMQVRGDTLVINYARGPFHVTCVTVWTLFSVNN